MLGRTPALAARWTIDSGPISEIQPTDPFAIADVQLDEPEPERSLRTSQVRVLDRGCVIGIKVIDGHNLATVGQQPIDKGRADESGAAGHDRCHVP